MRAVLTSEVAIDRGDPFMERRASGARFVFSPAVCNSMSRPFRTRYSPKSFLDARWLRTSGRCRDAGHK